MNREALRWAQGCIWRYGWLPILFFSVHLGVSKGMDAYLHFPRLDIPMHFFGGAVIAQFYWKSLHHPAAGPVIGAMPSSGRQLFTLCAVGATTAVWEFAEWWTDSIGLTTAQLSLDDTLLDMFLGMLGGVLFIWIAAMRQRSALD
ncbi:MAG: hypothetical protein QM477_10665 [Planctomycetota bacterium]